MFILPHVFEAAVDGVVVVGVVVVVDGVFVVVDGVVVVVVGDTVGISPVIVKIQI